MVPDTPQPPSAPLSPSKKRVHYLIPQVEQQVRPPSTIRQPKPKSSPNEPITKIPKETVVEMSPNELQVAKEVKILLEENQPQTPFEEPKGKKDNRPKQLQRDIYTGPVKPIGLQRDIDTTKADVEKVLSQQRVIEQEEKLKKAQQEEIAQLIARQEAERLLAQQEAERLLEEQKKAQLLEKQEAAKQSEQEKRKIAAKIKANEMIQRRRAFQLQQDLDEKRAKEEADLLARQEEARKIQKELDDQLAKEEADLQARKEEARKIQQELDDQRARDLLATQLLNQPKPPTPKRSRSANSSTNSSANNSPTRIRKIGPLRTPPQSQSIFTNVFSYFTGPTQYELTPPSSRSPSPLVKSRSSSRSSSRSRSRAGTDDEGPPPLKEATAVVVDEKTGKKLISFTPGFSEKVINPPLPMTHNLSTPPKPNPPTSQETLIITPTSSQETDPLTSEEKRKRKPNRSKEEIAQEKEEKEKKRIERAEKKEKEEKEKAEKAKAKEEKAKAKEEKVNVKVKPKPPIQGKGLLNQHEQNTHRFKVLKGELLAGNTSKLVVNEMKSLVKQLVQMGELTNDQSLLIIKELKTL